MSPNSLVTIIVPVFNAERYLAECLNSAIGQTYTEIEIICINDGSIDASGQILSRFKELDSRVLALTQPNQGLSVARNRGLMHATGEYVIFLDSDDALDLEAVEKLLAISRDQALDALFFDAVELNSEHADSSEGQPATLAAADTGPRFLLQDLNQRGWKPSACLQICRRDFLNTFDLRFEPGILHEDNLYTAQLLLRASRVARTNEALYRVRATPGSITRQVPGPSHVLGLLVCHSLLTRFVRRNSLTLSWKEKNGFRYVLADIVSNAVSKSQVAIRSRAFIGVFSQEPRLGTFTKLQFWCRRIDRLGSLSRAVRLWHRALIRLL